MNFTGIISGSQSPCKCHTCHYNLPDLVICDTAALLGHSVYQPSPHAHTYTHTLLFLPSHLQLCSFRFAAVSISAYNSSLRFSNAANQTFRCNSQQVVSMNSNVSNITLSVTTSNLRVQAFFFKGVDKFDAGTGAFWYLLFPSLAFLSLPFHYTSALTLPSLSITPLP